MIVSFKSKALKRYYYKGDGSKLKPEHKIRIAGILTQLDAAKVLEDMNFPGSSFHKLKGTRLEEYSVWVSGNWRITFRFENGDAFDINYEDYH
ncbi:MAG: type II toxin-antitoxin system RelE/ParE family toxin [Saprospiraceae bacterium]